jgi:hypothetical protein
MEIAFDRHDKMFLGPDGDTTSSTNEIYTVRSL